MSKKKQKVKVAAVPQTYQVVELVEGVAGGTFDNQNEAYELRDRLQEMAMATGMDLTQRRYAVRDGSLCPICGETAQLVGATTDGRLIGSCGDAFTARQWDACSECGEDPSAHNPDGTCPD
jgi:hypothetical protein